MRNINDLSNEIERIRKNIIKDLIKVQKETAKSICEDAKTFAPGKGPYKESIKVSETEIKNNKITTKITTDLTVEAKSNGNFYNLGYLLENGTMQHAIPNAFGLGYTYGYVDRYGTRHKGTLDKDWHPGFAPLPHFIPALLLNKEKYNIAIQNAVDNEFK